MKVIFAYQEVQEVVDEGYPALVEGATEAQRAVHRENKKKDNKALFFIHQCIDNAHFEKIASAKTSHEAWKILEKCNEGADQLKKVRLQTLRRQYELMPSTARRTPAPVRNSVCRSRMSRSGGKGSLPNVSMKPSYYFSVGYLSERGGGCQSIAQNSAPAHVKLGPLHPWWSDA